MRQLKEALIGRKNNSGAIASSTLYIIFSHDNLLDIALAKLFAGDLTKHFVSSDNERYYVLDNKDLDNFNKEFGIDLHINTSTAEVFTTNSMTVKDIERFIGMNNSWNIPRSNKLKRLC